MNYKNIKKIIFICKYNIFRSEIAEIYFNKINKNKSVKASSAGFIMGGWGDRVQKKVAKREKIPISFKPKPIKLKDLIQADLIVVVADDIPKIMFDYWLAPINKKIVFWKIPDEQKMNEKNIRKIVTAIKRKTEDLAKKLEKKDENRQH